MYAFELIITRKMYFLECKLRSLHARVGCMLEEQHAFAKKLYYPIKYNNLYYYIILKYSEKREGMLTLF
jgi:hypothetical protein